MGYWGTDIMEGDLPLDILYDPMARLKIHKNGPGEEEDTASVSDLFEDDAIRARFVAAMDDFWPDLKPWVESFKDQVLALCVLTVGTVAAGTDIDRLVVGGTRTLREATILSAEESAEDFRGVGDHDWAAARMAFAASLKSYDGTPVVLGGGWLFDAMECAMATKH